MLKEMRWYHHLAINAYWFGQSLASGIITPLLLPYLVVLYMPPELKNTHLATLRVVGLAVAMLVQPLAGLLSDRSTLRWGRRRPFIAAGSILSVICVGIMGSSLFFRDSPADPTFQAAFGISTAYAVLLAGIIFLQFSSNLAHGALQGIIPDVVPPHHRGLTSGVKSVMELLPVFLVLFVGPLIDRGMVWLVICIMMAGYLSTMLVTILFVKEEQNTAVSHEPLREPFLRMLALTGIFVGSTRIAVWLVTASGRMVSGESIATLVTVAGAAGLLGMAGSIFAGVYLGAWVGIGAEARRQRPFIWWVINRLMFLAAVGSIQSFAQFYLRDVLHVPNPASSTTILLAVVAVFLIPSALLGGSLADRIGRRRLLVAAGLVAALGALLLLFAAGMPLVIAAGCLIGLGTGTFMASNWALGTELVPPQNAGRYLGISNLAGAGAGIVGAGIGGPMADMINQAQPGLGYIVIFAIYGGLFLLSVLTLLKIRRD